MEKREGRMGVVLVVLVGVGLLYGCGDGRTVLGRYVRSVLSRCEVHIYFIVVMSVCLYLYLLYSTTTEYQRLKGRQHEITNYHVQSTTRYNYHPYVLPVPR
jgi:hypothetical protein